MTIVFIGKYLSYLGLFLMSLTLFIILRNRTYRIRYLKYFCLYIVTSFLINIPAFIMAYHLKNNLPLLHIFTIAEFVLIAMFYVELIYEKRVRVLAYVIAFIAFLMLMNSIFIQGIYAFNSYAKTVSQVILLSLSIIFLFKSDSFNNSGDVRNYRYLSFINAAFLIYFSGSLFIFMSSQFLLESSSQLNKLWLINSILSLIFQIIILYAVWKIAYPRIRSSP